MRSIQLRSPKMVKQAHPFTHMSASLLPRVVSILSRSIIDHQFSYEDSILLHELDLAGLDLITQSRKALLLDT